jgi:putative transcriptional regulator
VKNRIRELRARHGLTQEELAAKAGVRRETIHFLEAGKYNPSLELAFRVSRALKSGVEEVFEFGR